MQLLAQSHGRCQQVWAGVGSSQSITAVSCQKPPATRTSYILHRPCKVAMLSWSQQISGIKERNCKTMKSSNCIVCLPDRGSSGPHSPTQLSSAHLINQPSILSLLRSHEGVSARVIFHLIGRHVRELHVVLAEKLQQSRQA